MRRVLHWGEGEGSSFRTEGVPSRSLKLPCIPGHIGGGLVLYDSWFVSYNGERHFCIGLELYCGEFSFLISGCILQNFIPCLVLVRLAFSLIFQSQPSYPRLEQRFQILIVGGEDGLI